MIVEKLCVCFEGIIHSVDGEMMWRQASHPSKIEEKPSGFLEGSFTWNQRRATGETARRHEKSPNIRGRSNANRSNIGGRLKKNRVYLWRSHSRSGPPRWHRRSPACMEDRTNRSRIYGRYRVNQELTWYYVPGDEAFHICRGGRKI